MGIVREDPDPQEVLGRHPWRVNRLEPLVHRRGTAPSARHTASGPPPPSDLVNAANRLPGLARGGLDSRWFGALNASDLRRPRGSRSPFGVPQLCGGPVSLPGLASAPARRPAASGGSASPAPDEVVRPPPPRVEPRCSACGLVELRHRRSPDQAAAPTRGLRDHRRLEGYVGELRGTDVCVQGTCRSNSHCGVLLDHRAAGRLDQRARRDVGDLRVSLRERGDTSAMPGRFRRLCRSPGSRATSNRTERSPGHLLAPEEPAGPVIHGIVAPGLRGGEIEPEK